MVASGIQDLYHSLGGGGENDGLAQLSGGNANVSEVFFRVEGGCELYVVEEDDYLSLARSNAPLHPSINVEVDGVNGRPAGAVPANNIPEDHFQVLSPVNRLDRAIPFPVSWAHVERHTTRELSNSRLGAYHIAFQSIGPVAGIENSISVDIVRSGSGASEVAGVVGGGAGVYPEHVSPPGKHSHYVSPDWSPTSCGSVRLDKKYRFYVLLKNVVFQSSKDPLRVVFAVSEGTSVGTVIEGEDDFDYIFFDGGRAWNRCAFRRRASRESRAARFPLFRGG